MSSRTEDAPHLSLPEAPAAPLHPSWSQMEISSFWDGFGLNRWRQPAQIQGLGLGLVLLVPCPTSGWSFFLSIWSNTQTSSVFCSVHREGLQLPV